MNIIIERITYAELFFYVGTHLKFWVSYES